MHSKFRSHLSYANVMATVAVFVALGGSSYAAIKVTGKNVKNSSLTGRDVKNNSLKGADVTALGTGDIRDSSLLARDFKPGQLPAGAKGPQGPKGDPGSALGYALIKTDGTVDPTRSKNVVRSRKLYDGFYCIEFVGEPRHAIATARAQTPFAVSAFAGSDSGGPACELDTGPYDVAVARDGAGPVYVLVN